MKFLGDTKAETIADTKVNWLILLQWLSSPTLHCILISCITLQPFHTFYHSGFHKSRSVRCQLHHIFSLFNVSLPLLRPRGPTGKRRCLHFYKVPSLSLSGSSFLGPCWNKVDGNNMGKFWHHWLHDAVVAFSWCRWTDLKFPLTDKCFPWGVSWWFSRTFTSWGSPNL